MKEEYTVVTIYSEFLFALNFFSSDSFVTVTAPSPSDLHQSWAFVHDSVIDAFTAQSRDAVLSATKNRCRIEPEVLAVGDAAPAIGVLLLSLPCGSATTRDGLNEGIHAEEATQLLELSSMVLVVVATATASRHRCESGVERFTSGCDGSVARKLMNAIHILESSHGASDLYGLGEEKHEDPEKLKGSPGSKKKGKGIRVDKFAKTGPKDIAFIRGFLQERGEVCHGQNKVEQHYVRGSLQ